VVAIVDPDATRAATLASRFRGCRVLTDLDEALGLADVVHVCTPTASHVALARQVLQGGRHLLIEKPLAASVADTAALLAEAESRQRLICPTHQFVFQRGMRRLVHELASIGALRHIEFTMCSAGAAGRPGMEDAVADEILPHPLSILQRVLQRPIADLEWVVRRPLAGELHAIAGIAGAAIGLTVSMTGRPTVNGAVLIGTAGTFEIDLFHGYAVRYGGGVSRARKAAQPLARSAALGATAALNLARRALHGQPAYPGLWELVDEFYRACATGGPSPISPADTLDVALAVERLGRREAPISV
jgi:predicted dehydrogenase